MVNEVFRKTSIVLRAILNGIKRKTNNFSPLMKFLCAKNCCFVVQCSLDFVLLVEFCFFCVPKISLKKIETVLIASFTILLKCTPPQPSYRELFFTKFFYLYPLILIFMHLFSFVKTYFYLHALILISENLFFFITTCKNLFSSMII